MEFELSSISFVAAPEALLLSGFGDVLVYAYSDEFVVFGLPLF